MTDLIPARTKWTSYECSRAAFLWQRHIVDIYGDNHVPVAVRNRVKAMIATDLNRNVESVCIRFDRNGPTFGYAYAVGRPQPVEQLAQWAARCEAYSRRSPQAELLGDPPPGFSALDQRRAGDAR